MPRAHSASLMLQGMVVESIAKIGSIYVHAMSFGGLLPDAVNDRYNNTQILLQVYRMRPVFEHIAFNEDYIVGRLRGNEGAEDADNKRNRYLRHFKEMAARGFYSFDRDLIEDNVYHLIAMPVGRESYKMKCPEIPSIVAEKICRIDGRDMRIVL